MPADLLTSDPETVGPYRLIGRLGTGGMGQVYLARSPGGRLVAVKVIRPELAADGGFRSRFAREVSAARSVSGMFTAPVVDADPDGRPPWLATAYVPGPTLADAVTERGPLPPAVVVTLAAGLAEALVAIHAAGLVHRDLKPSNVLLAGDGPRVIDFGISRAADASALTLTGTIMGSPGYLSPEQADGRPVGPPGDVFSLGAVLAFAAGGAGPFGGGPAAALAFRVVHAEPDLSAVPRQLRPLIARCLAKDPADRPTPSELLSALRADRAEPPWLTPPHGAATENGDAAAGDGSATAVAGGPPPAEPTPSRGPAPSTEPTGAHPGAPPGPPTPIGPTGGRPAAPLGPPRPVGRPGRGRAGRRRRTRSAVTVAVLAVAVVWIALASSHWPAAGPAAGPTDRPAPPSASGTASATPASGPARPAVDGVWTGTYDCDQGVTGVRLTITGSVGGSLKATFVFYPVAANPGVADGSYELAGSYSAAAGLVLNPVSWISQPAGYQMVGLSAPPPRAGSMTGAVDGSSCSTFSVRR
jgi:Protein kinase domain